MRTRPLTCAPDTGAGRRRPAISFRLAIFPLLAVAPLPAAEKQESRWKDDRLACAACHEDIVKAFRPTAHGKAMEFGAGAKDVTCVSCHTGDAAKHMESADPKLIHNPGKDKPGEVAESCLGCHANQKQLMFWRGSSHQMAEIGCASCHSVHKPSPRGRLLAKQTEAETCFACHNNVRKAFVQRSTHLIRDERGMSRVECSACHNPHGSQTEKLISANHVNEKCYSCHQEKRGPFLYEHAPVREDCMSCHSAHGSNNTGLLKMRMPQLCQTCHIQGRHQSVAGRPNALWNINRNCVQCHSQVHGSNHPSGTILMR